MMNQETSTLEKEKWISLSDQASKMK